MVDLQSYQLQLILGLVSASLCFTAAALPFPRPQVLSTEESSSLFPWHFSFGSLGFLKNVFRAKSECNEESRSLSLQGFEA